MSDRIDVAVRVAVTMAMCVSAATGVYAADAAPAEDTPASNEGIAEVIVTSQRREESLSKVPISITAITQQDIDNKGIKDITDVARFTPGISVDTTGTANIAIRGIASSGGSGTTGIYIDDTPIQMRGLAFNPDEALPKAFDIERVEVLRGPQGTLFGAGAEGGVVRFITPTPSLTKDSAYVRSEVSSTDHGGASYELGAAYGAPIIDNVLGFRFSASFRRDGGWVDRANYSLNPPTDPTMFNRQTPVLGGVTEPHANWHETITVRGALKWAVNDDVTVTPSIYYQKLHINDTASYWVSLSNPVAGRYYNGNALTNPSFDPFWLAAVKVEWNLGFAQLTSNTSYFHRQQHSTSDYTQYLRATYGFFGQLPSIFPQSGATGYATFADEQKNWYEEIRLASDSTGRFVWNGGVFFSHLDENIPENIFDTTLRQEILDYTAAAYPPGNQVDLCNPLDCPNGRIFHGPIDKVVDKQIALFGEVTYKITDTLKVTGGLRVSKVDFTGSTYAGGPFLGTPDAPTSASASEKPITPKGVLSWEPDRDNLYYVSASKGYRVGGVNVGVGTICEGDLQALGLPVGPNGLHQVPTKFASDNLWSYEIGGKNSFLDHRLQINSSLFWINWRNIQQNVYLPSCGEQFTANLGQVVSRGGDIDIQFKPIDSVFLELTAAYTDAKFSKASCAGVLQFDSSLGKCAGPTGSSAPIVSEGDRLLGAPWSFTAAAEKTFPGWEGHLPYLRFDFQYQTKQTALLQGTDPRNALYDTIHGLPLNKNLTVRGGFRWNGYDISAFADNALNQHPELFLSRDIASNATDNLYFARGARPRTYGLTATYRF